MRSGFLDDNSARKRRRPEPKPPYPNDTCGGSDDDCVHDHELGAGTAEHVRSAGTDTNAKAYDPALRLKHMMHNQKLHRLFGHAKMSRLISLQKMGLCMGIKVLGNGEMPFCATCVQCKKARPKVSKRTLKRSYVRGGRVFTDLKEVEQRSYGGHKWAIHFIDDATRFAKSYYLKEKSDAWLALRRYVTEELDPRGIKLQTLRFDGGSEYGRRGEVYKTSSKFRQYLNSKPQGAHISVERAAAYVPEHVGVVERYNRTVFDMVRCILRDQNRDKRLWPWALHGAQKIINTLQSSALPDGTSPHVEWTREICDISRWHYPLCTCYPVRPRPIGGLKALEDRSDKFIYIGESRESPTYYLLDARTMQGVERRYEEVTFQEDELPAQESEQEATAPSTRPIPHRDDATATETDARPWTPYFERALGGIINPGRLGQHADEDEADASTSQVEAAARTSEAQGGATNEGDASRPAEPPRAPRRKDQRQHPRAVRFGDTTMLDEPPDAVVSLDFTGSESEPCDANDAAEQSSREVNAANDETDHAQEHRRRKKRKRSVELKTMRELPPQDTGRTSRSGRRLYKPSRLQPRRTALARTTTRVARAHHCWSNIDLQEPEHALDFDGDGRLHQVFEYPTRKRVRHVKGVIDEPKSIKAALLSEHKKAWWDAIMAEWNGLWDMDTFEWVMLRDLPKDAKPLHLLWRFKVKPDRLKARCCINGKQEDPTDYDNIYAPVCRYSTLRILLWKAVQNPDFVHGNCDVCQAYLYADNPVDQYAYCPPEFNKPGMCLRIKKMLYGLHASGLKWNEVMDEWLLEQGFTRSMADKCLYTKRVLRDGEWKEMYLCLFVDDAYYTGSKELIDEFLTAIQARFKIRTEGGSRYLGININFDDENGVVELDQCDYIDKVLRRFGMLECKTCKTPMARKSNGLLPRLEGECKDKKRQTMFRQMVGCMMFLAVTTRPDICYAVKELSRHLVHPDQRHVKAAQRVLRYLSGTKDWTLRYAREDKIARFYGSSDADFAGEHETAKSTTGYAFSLGSGAVSWKAGTQAIVAHSSTEAEMMALDEAAREYMYLTQLLQDFHINVKLPVTLFQDNMSTIKLVQAGHFNARTRHMNVRYHYTHNLVEEGALLIKHKRTDLLPSDALTKSVEQDLHLRHSAVLLGHAELEGVC